MFLLVLKRSCNCSGGSRQRKMTIPVTEKIKIEGLGCVKEGNSNTGEFPVWNPIGITNEQASGPFNYLLSSCHYLFSNDFSSLPSFKPSKPTSMYSELVASRGTA